VAASVVGIQEISKADTYAGCYAGGSGCLPDSNLQTWCFGATMDGHANLKDASEYAMANLESETDMFTSQMACDPDHVDVVFQELDLTGTTRGEYECLNFVVGNTCDRSAVRYDSAEINDQGPANYLQGNRDKTACHEVGHSAGLAHHDPPYDATTAL